MACKREPSFVITVTSCLLWSLQMPPYQYRKRFPSMYECPSIKLRYQICYINHVTISGITVSMIFAEISQTREYFYWRRYNQRPLKNFKWAQIPAKGHFLGKWAFLESSHMWIITTEIQAKQIITSLRHRAVSDSCDITDTQRVSYVFKLKCTISAEQIEWALTRQHREIFSR